MQRIFISETAVQWKLSFLCNYSVHCVLLSNQNLNNTNWNGLKQSQWIGWLLPIPFFSNCYSAGEKMSGVAACS